MQTAATNERAVSSLLSNHIHLVAESETTCRKNYDRQFMFILEFLALVAFLH